MNHDITLCPVSGMEGVLQLGNWTALTPTQCPNLLPFFPAAHLCKGPDWGYEDNTWVGIELGALSPSP